MRAWWSHERIRGQVLGWLRSEDLTPIEMRRRLVGTDAGFLRELFGPSFGALYAALDELESEGLVTSRIEPGGPARDGRPQRRYRAT